MKRKQLLIGLAGLLIFVLGLGALTWFGLEQQSRSWAEQRREIESAWRPGRTQALVEPGRSVAGNAWDAYLPAIRAFSELQEAELQEAEPQEMGDEAREILAQLVRGTCMQRSELSPAAALGFGGQEAVSAVSAFELGEVLLERARSHRAAEDFASAREELFALGVYARDLGDVGATIYGLVGLSLLDSCAAEFRALLVDAPELAQTLAKDVATLRAHMPRVARTFDGERAGMMQLLEEPEHLPEELRTSFFGSLLLRHAANDYFSALRALGRSAELPWSEAQQHIAKLQQSLESPGLLQSLNPMRDMIVVRSVCEWPGRFRQVEARLALVEAAARLRAGVTGELPEDPFGPGGLALREEARELVLWSRGLDGLDDGGEGSFENADESKDLVLRLPRL